MKLFPPRIGLVRLSIFAIIVGIITGIGAVFFRALIGLIHNVAFFGVFSVNYDANVFTPPSPWGALIILVPVAGGMIVTFLVQNFAPEARGHGVPEVMDAIYYREGKIRPIVAAVKSLASAISIGTGAAVGREGPIIQIGASLGSSLGQFVHMAPWQRITLVAAGAGAGIAATFNTPIGGVMFAIELMLPEISARTFLPVALATGTATFIGRIFLGLQPAFAVPAALLNSDKPASLTALLLYALLGALMGLAATAFIKGLGLAEDVFEKIKNGYLRHAIGMLLIGSLMYVLLRTSGQYYVDGVGYATIQAILSGGLIVPGLLALLFVAKLCATSVSLGSGASGGIFSPSLFMGATIGGAFGAAISAIHPVDGLGVTTCAMIGMAAMVGGGTGAAMTAVTMIFEMTRDYDLVMPIIVAVALAIGVRRLLVAGEHLHGEARRAETLRAQGAARQHVPGAPRRRSDGARRHPAAEGHAAGDVPAPGRPRRPHEAHRGDRRRPHRRRAARQHCASARAGGRRAGLHGRRDRAAQLHGGARGGHRIRCGHAHGAAQCRYGGGDQGQGSPARR